MPTPIAALSVLSATLAPAVMVSACGLILLGFNNKYSHVIASLRSLSVEVRRLPPEDTDPSAALRDRRSQIRVQSRLLRRRLTSVLWQIRAIAGAAVLFLASSLLLEIQALTARSLEGPTVFLVSGGLVAMALGLMSAIVEVSWISQTADSELRSVSEGPVH